MHEIWTFFYGSYINFEVLREVGIVPARFEVASLAGFDLRIRPLADLVRSGEHTAYGINATATHAELVRLYQHASDILGATYLPEAVLTRTEEGVLRPALTYLSPGMQDADPDPAYVERIARAAREFGFPDWYLERIEGFRP